MNRKTVARLGALALALVGMGSAKQAQAAWANETAMPTALKFTASCAIAGDKMLVAGGLTAAGAASNVVQLMTNGAPVVWKDSTSSPAIPNLPAARYEGKMVKLDGLDSCVYIGGRDNTGAAVTTIYEYNLTRNTWVTLGATLNLSRYGFAPLVFKASGGVTEVLLIGGQAGATYRDTIEVFTATVANGQLAASGVVYLRDNTPANIDFGTPRSYSQAVMLTNGANSEIYIIGGFDGVNASTLVSRVVLVTATGAFVSQTNTFVNLSAGRFKLNAFADTLTVGGTQYEIVVTNGDDGSTAPVSGASVTELINTTGAGSPSVTNGTTIGTPRLDAQQVEIGGDVLIVGGYDGLAEVDSSEKWLRATDGWQAAVTMIGRYNGFACEYLSTPNKVFVAGGQDSGSAALTSTQSGP